MSAKIPVDHPPGLESAFAPLSARLAPSKYQLPSVGTVLIAYAQPLETIYALCNDKDVSVPGETLWHLVCTFHRDVTQLIEAKGLKNRVVPICYDDEDRENPNVWLDEITELAISKAEGEIKELFASKRPRQDDPPSSKN